MARAWIEPYEDLFIELTPESYADAVDLKDGKEVTPS